MTVLLAVLAVLVPALVTLIGYWFNNNPMRGLRPKRHKSQNV